MPQLMTAFFRKVMEEKLSPVNTMMPGQFLTEVLEAIEQERLNVEEQGIKNEALFVCVEMALKACGQDPATLENVYAVAKRFSEEAFCEGLVAAMRPVMRA